MLNNEKRKGKKKNLNYFENALSRSLQQLQAASLNFSLSTKIRMFMSC